MTKQITGGMIATVNDSYLRVQIDLNFRPPDDEIVSLFATVIDDDLDVLQHALEKHQPVFCVVSKGDWKRLYRIYHTYTGGSVVWDDLNWRAEFLEAGVSTADLNDTMDSLATKEPPLEQCPWCGSLHAGGTTDFCPKRPKQPPV